jgi:taurine-pyruvate aminotransferase
MGTPLDSSVDGLVALAKKHTWFSNGHEQSEYLQPGRIVVRQSGNELTDIFGNSYLEALSGFAGCTLGRSNSTVVDAIIDELRHNPIVVTGGGATPKQILLSKQIAERMPDRGERLNRVIYSCNGSDANETAFKVARQYWKIRGEGSRYKIISRWGSYHGCHFGTLSASGYTFRRTGAEPLVPGFLHTNPPQCLFCPYKCYPQCTLQCADELEALIQREGPDTIAAWIGDLVITALGPAPAPPDYPKRIREICDKYGILMIVDEVITGWGRMGTWTASELYGVVPDILTLAKGLSALYLPLAATVVKEEIANAFSEDLLQHVYTSAGSPVACAAGLAVIDYIEENELLARVQEKAKVVQQQCSAIKDEFCCVGETYAIGLEFGFQLVADQKSLARIRDREKLGRVLLEASIKEGVLLAVFEDCIICAPSLTISDQELDRIFGAIKRGLREVTGVLPSLL